MAHERPRPLPHREGDLGARGAGLRPDLRGGHLGPGEAGVTVPGLDPPAVGLQVAGPQRAPPARRARREPLPDPGLGEVGEAAQPHGADDERGALAHAVDHPARRVVGLRVDLGEVVPPLLVEGEDALAPGRDLLLVEEAGAREGQQPAQLGHAERRDAADLGLVAPALGDLDDDGHRPEAPGAEAEEPLDRAREQREKPDLLPGGLGPAADADVEVAAPLVELAQPFEAALEVGVADRGCAGDPERRAHLLPGDAGEPRAGRSPRRRARAPRPPGRRRAPRPPRARPPGRSRSPRTPAPRSAGASGRCPPARSPRGRGSRGAGGPAGPGPGRGGGSCP